MAPLGWRIYFLTGLLPAIMALPLRMFVEEPERFVEQKEKQAKLNVDAANVASKKAVSESQSLLSKAPREPTGFDTILGPELRSQTLIATTMVTSCIFVFWGMSAWIPTLVRKTARRDGLGKEEQDTLVSIAILLQNAGSILGSLSVAFLARAFGRRKAFWTMTLGGTLAGCISLLYLSSDLYLFLAGIPFIGAFTNGVFSLWPLYLPELFPTAVRATGLAFCFNIGRPISALGPLCNGVLSSWLGSDELVAAFLIIGYVPGWIACYYAIETKGKRLE